MKVHQNVMYYQHHHGTIKISFIFILISIIIHKFTNSLLYSNNNPDNNCFSTCSSPCDCTNPNRCGAAPTPATTHNTLLPSPSNLNGSNVMMMTSMLNTPAFLNSSVCVCCFSY